MKEEQNIDSDFRGVHVGQLGVMVLFILSEAGPRGMWNSGKRGLLRGWVKQQHELGPAPGKELHMHYQAMQLILEWHRFDLCGSTYTQIFLNQCLLWFRLRVCRCRLEHLWGLVSAGSWNQSPEDSEGQVKFLGNQNYVQIFDGAGVGTHNPHTVQGSAVFSDPGLTSPFLRLPTRPFRKQNRSYLVAVVVWPSSLPQIKHLPKLPMTGVNHLKLGFKWHIIRGCLC